VGVQPLVQGGIVGGVAAVALGHQHPEQLAAPCHQRAQVPGRLVRQGAHRRPDRLGEAGDRPGVQAVGLGQPAHGAGEGTDLARVDHRDRQACCRQGRGEADLQAAGGLEHDERRGKRDQTLDQRRYLPLIMVDREALPGGAQVDIEPALGDVDADEHGSSLVHDPASLDAGLLISPGDRSGRGDTAGGAPGFGPALLDPWESGLPSAYPIPVPDRATPTYEMGKSVLLPSRTRGKGTSHLLSPSRGATPAVGTRAPT
jgi:hypothetical protein